MPRSVIAILHYTWIVLMVIFGALIVTENIGGYQSVAFAGVIMLVFLTEMWGRFGPKEEE